MNCQWKCHDCATSILCTYPKEGGRSTALRQLLPGCSTWLCRLWIWSPVSLLTLFKTLRGSSYLMLVKDSPTTSKCNSCLNWILNRFIWLPMRRVVFFLPFSRCILRLIMILPGFFSAVVFQQKLWTLRLPLGDSHRDCTCLRFMRQLSPKAWERVYLFRGEPYGLIMIDVLMF